MQNDNPTWAAILIISALMFIAITGTGFKITQSIDKQTAEITRQTELMLDMLYN
jgi:hypothetical protein